MADVINAVDQMVRWCALEKECITALTDANGAAYSPTPVCEAFPRWSVKCETFPYWINRTGHVDPLDEYGEEMSGYRYTIINRLVWAHYTANYAGEVDEQINVVIPQFIRYITQRELLQSAAYPTAPTDIRWARFAGCTGWSIMEHSPGGALQVGAEFTWTVDFDQQNNQVYP